MANKFPLDLSSFKKTKSDKDFTTLKHKDGHEIKIAHNSLNPKMRSQITKLPEMLADGGEPDATPKPTPNPDYPYTNVPKTYSPNAKNVLDPQGRFKADGGQIKAYADGGGAIIPPDSEQEIPQGEPGPQQPSAPLEITPVNDDLTDKSTPVQTPPQAQPASMQEGSPAEDQAVQGLMTPDQPKPQSMVDDIYGNGIEQSKAAEDAKAKAAGDLGKAQAQVIAARNKELTDQAITSQAALQHITDQSQSIAKDIQDNHINPNQHLDNMSTGQKVQTAIGLILGGIGGGLMHQANPALQFLNNQIDRDLQAQQANMNKSHNLLSALNAQYGNMAVASNMFRLAKMDLLKNDLDKAAAQSASPTAAAAAQAAKAQIDLKYGPLKAATAAQIGQQASGGNNNVESRLQVLRMLNPEAAKSLEERYVPSVGVATIPVSKEDRDKLQAGTNFMNSVNDLRQWAEKHQGSLNPAIVNEGKTKAASLQQLYRNAGHLGVYKESEAPLLNQVIPSDPTAFLNKLRVDPQLKAVNEEAGRNLNSLHQFYGLPQKSMAPQLSPQQQSFVDWAKSNPNDPRSQVVLKKYLGQ